MASMTTSLDPSFSFVNITDSDFNDQENLTTLNERDFTLCQSVSDDLPSTDFSEALLNVNRSLLVELQTEQMKNLQLAESYKQMKNELDDLKMNSTKNLSMTKDDNETTNLALPVDKNDVLINSGSSLKSNSSIKEEHLIELNNYLQSELSVCKKEMYAMNSRMVGFVENMKSLKKQCSEISTQTETKENQTDEPFTFLSVETQTDEDFSMVSVVPDQDILLTKHESELNSLKTWFSSAFNSYSNEIQPIAPEILPEIDVKLSENVSVKPPQTLYPKAETESVRCSTFSFSNVSSGVDSISAVKNVVPLNFTISNLTEQNSRNCPICRIVFAEIDEIQMHKHVNEHLDTDQGRFCPMCSLKFDGVCQDYFENHVHSHFVNVNNETIEDWNFYAHSLIE